MAVGFSDGLVRVWDVEHGYITHNFREHQGVISALKFHPDPLRLLLISCADDCSVRVWDLKAKKYVS